MENAINMVLAIVLVHPLGVRGLALSLSVAYTVGALVGAWRAAPVVRAARARPAVWAPLRRVGLATVRHGRGGPGGVQPVGPTRRTALLVRVVGSVLAGSWPTAGLTDLPAAQALARRSAPTRHGRTARPAGAGSSWQTPWMPGVRIVTDSACDLTAELVKQHDDHRGAL